VSLLNHRNGLLGHLRTNGEEGRNEVVGVRDLHRLEVEPGALSRHPGLDNELAGSLPDGDEMLGVLGGARVVWKPGLDGLAARVAPTRRRLRDRRARVPNVRDQLVAGMAEDGVWAHRRSEVGSAGALEELVVFSTGVTVGHEWAGGPMKVDYILALVEAFVFVPIAMNQSVRRLKSSTHSPTNALFQSKRKL